MKMRMMTVGGENGDGDGDVRMMMIMTMMTELPLLLVEHNTVSVWNELSEMKVLPHVKKYW